MRKVIGMPLPPERRGGVVAGELVVTGERGEQWQEAAQISKHDDNYDSKVT
jgi:hypothetical protein